MHIKHAPHNSQAPTKPPTTPSSQAQQPHIQPNAPTTGPGAHRVVRLLSDLGGLEAPASIRTALPTPHTTTRSQTAQARTRACQRQASRGTTNITEHHSPGTGPPPPSPWTSNSSPSAHTPHSQAHAETSHRLPPETSHRLLSARHHIVYLQRDNWKTTHAPPTKHPTNQKFKKMSDTGTPGQRRRKARRHRQLQQTTPTRDHPHKTRRTSPSPQSTPETSCQQLKRTKIPHPSSKP